MSTMELSLVTILACWVWRKDWIEARRLLLTGIWTGLLATLAYDVVRVPIVHSGIPVFKAISYFGIFRHSAARSGPAFTTTG